MLVLFSVRHYSCVSIKQLTMIRSSSSCVLKHCIFLSPKLSTAMPRAICLPFSRRHCSKLVSSDVIEDCSDRDESIYLYRKLSRKENISRLMDCVECSETLATAMLKEYPKLRYISSREILRTMKLLLERDISMENIMKHYGLLALQFGETEEKFTILAMVGISNFNLAAPLLLIPLDSLKKTVNWALMIVKPQEKTKLSVICDMLKCHPAEIVLAASVHKFLQTVPFERMTDILQILLAEGVPPHNILRDLWVVRYKKERVLERLNQVKEAGVEPFKTWMVRCTDKILQTSIRIQMEKRVLLAPHNDSTVEYVASRLNLTLQQAEMIFDRHPQLRGVGAVKLRDTFDFLLGKEGKKSVKTNSEDLPKVNEDISPHFNASQIWHSSRILCHSLDTMKARMVRLRTLGFEPYNPIILYKSKKKFEELVQKLQEKQDLGEGLKEDENFDATIENESIEGQTHSAR